MRIGVISDTHGSLKAFEQAIHQFGEVDLLLHAGDVLYHGPRNPLPEGHNPSGLAEKLMELEIPHLMVKGNVDAEVDDWVLPYPLPPYALVQNGLRRIAIYHGSQHETLEERVKFAKRFGAQILVFGHLHRPMIEKQDGVIILNPGSVALPKQEPREATFAVIEEDVLRVCALADGRVLLEKNYR